MLQARVVDPILVQDQGLQFLQAAQLRQAVVRQARISQIQIADLRQKLDIAQQRIAQRAIRGAQFHDLQRFARIVSHPVRARDDVRHSALALQRGERCAPVPGREMGGVPLAAGCLIVGELAIRQLPPQRLGLLGRHIGHRQLENLESFEPGQVLEPLAAESRPVQRQGAQTRKAAQGRQRLVADSGPHQVQRFQAEQVAELRQAVAADRCMNQDQAPQMPQVIERREPGVGDGRRSQRQFVQVAQGAQVD